MTEKRCSRCGDTKALDDFQKGHGRGGRAVWCRACYRDYNAARYRANPAAALATHRLRRYGLDQDGFDQLLQHQGGVCPGCGCVPSDDPNHGWHVDHDHETGSVRGLLCRFCNLAVGNAKDDPDRLEALAAYVRA